MTTVFHDAAGMTLAEVIIACAIVGVGLVALLGAIPIGTSLIGESNVKTTATFFAEQRLERIKNAQWTAAPAVDNLGGANSGGSEAVAQWPDEDYGNAENPRFRREVRIADCSVVSCSGIPTGTVSVNTLRQVTVTVFFRASSGPGTAATEQSVQLVTLIARRA